MARSFDVIRIVAIFRPPSILRNHVTGNDRIDYAAATEER
jgi:hypothetical protein